MKRHFLIVLAFVSLAGRAQTVTFYSPRCVRILHQPSDAVGERKSLVVTAQPADVRVSVRTVGDTRIYRTSALTVSVCDGKVSFADAKGHPLTAEAGTSFAPLSEGPDRGAFRVRQAFGLRPDEHVYGIGMLQNGKLSQRGENRKMQQSNLEDYAHFYQSSRGYGIFWDNYSPTQITIPDWGEEGSLALESEVGSAADYYFLYGGDADGVIREMRSLSGRVPMLPLWTYGYHQSRERYKSQDQLLEVVRRFRELGLPLDGIIQDWQYWGSNYTWNAMEFLSEEFAQPRRMIDEVHRLGAHLSISVWSSFGPQTKQFARLKEKDHLLEFETWPQSALPFWPPRMDYPSGVRCYDVYSAEARDIYWEHLSALHGMGVDAWWMDSTDPDHHSYKDSDLDIPTALGSYRSVRNLFPLMAVGGVHDHQRAVDSLHRVFILTRSYFAGQQRYGANAWSGDIQSSWESFRRQIPLCLSYTLTANPNVNTDIGGFFAGAYNTQGPNSATRNPQFQELYARWMQFGAFCPMMRSHGTDVWREPYYYGEPGSPVYEALADAIRLRYRLLPYTYSLAWQVSSNDDSFMRALFMDFPDDPETWNMATAYMYGHSLLVSPVLQPLYTPERVLRGNELSGWLKTAPTGEDYPDVDWTAERSYKVYLPARALWYDYYTEQPLQGGRHIEAPAPLNRMPLYVRAGSILPLGPDVQYVGERTWDTLDVVVYPGADGRFTLYEDEGDGYNYERGLCSTIPFVWDDKRQSLTIGDRQGRFPGMPERRTFRIRVVGGDVKTITYTGKKVRV